MVFWIVSALITLAIAGILIGAVWSGRRPVMTAAASDLAVYRDQLAEVERDLARGVLTEAEADAVRTEVSRRLLDADKRANAEQAQAAGQVWPAAALVALVLLIGAAWLYTTFGAPGYRDLPMTERLAALEAAAADRPTQAEAEAQAAPFLPKPPDPDPDYLALIERLRETVAERPDDIRGVKLLAQHEAQLGNFTAARKAHEQIIALRGRKADRTELTLAVEVMVFGTGGYISPEAEVLVNRILQTDPLNGPARYYTGLLELQTGRPDTAFAVWRKLLEDSPPNAPWVPAIEAEIEGIAAAAGINYVLPQRQRGPTEADIAAASDMSEEDRTEMIQGMVEGLAARLADEGGPPEDWARLFSALTVLGDTERAQAIADEARQVFAQSETATFFLNDAIEKAGLE